MTTPCLAKRCLLLLSIVLSDLEAADWLSLYSTGEDKFRRGLLAEARQDLKQALEGAEAGTVGGIQRAAILDALGRVEFQAGRLRPAISYYERALAFLPPAGQTADLFNIAQAYRELGDSRAAERYARSALALSPADPRILRLLGSALIQQRRYEEAESIERKALSKGDPAIAALVWTDLSTIEEARRRYASAAEMLQRAIEAMAPSHARARALSNLALLEQRLKRFPDAVMHARQSVHEMETHVGPKHNDLCEALERYADALRRSGQSEEARQTAKRVKELRSLLAATVDIRSLKD